MGKFNAIINGKFGLNRRDDAKKTGIFGPSRKGIPPDAIFAQGPGKKLHRNVSSDFA
jgi:hypothetical protein